MPQLITDQVTLTTKQLPIEVIEAEIINNESSKENTTVIKTDNNITSTDGFVKNTVKEITKGIIHGIIESTIEGLIYKKGNSSKNKSHRCNSEQQRKRRRRFRNK